MRDANMQEFDDRMRRINRRHRKLSRGFVTMVNSDGLIVAKPARTRLGFPWRGLLLTLIALLTFKAMLYQQLGPQDYAARVASLQSGSVVDQIGAYAMTIDPVTVFIAGLLADLPF